MAAIAMIRSLSRMAWQRVSDDDRAHGRIERALVLGIPLAFLVLALARAWPYADDLPLSRFEANDWYSYKVFAMSIVRDGLAMPAIGVYGGAGVVHGFLYNYFLASIFAVLGENTSIVYVVQSLLAGTSASLLYLALRGRVSRPLGLAFLLAAALYMYVDLYRYLSFRLLSENLFLFLLSAFFLAFVTAFDRRSGALAALAGVLLGLALLSRPSALGAAVGVVGLATLVSLRDPARSPLRLPLWLAAGAALALALLPVREIAATGRPDILLFTDAREHWLLPPTDSLPAFAEHYGRRIAFTLGFTTAIDPAYRWRPHWMAIWIGCLGYIATLLRLRRGPELWEWAILLFLVLYLGPVLLFSYVDNYGGRMLVVVMPLAAMLAVRFLDNVLRTPLAPRPGQASSAPA